MSEQHGIPNDALWIVEAYRPPNQGGGMLFSTWHRTDASKDIEVSAIKSRMSRGEISSARVVHRQSPFETILILEP